MKTLVLLGISLVIAGCTTPFRPWNLSEIREGMDREQVIRILGQPDTVEFQDGAEYLHYVYQEDYNPSLSAEPFYNMDSERAFQALDSGEAFKQYEYVVILTEGKVINYKEL